MYAPQRGMRCFLWLALTFCSMATAEGAIGSGNVLVLFNNASTAGSEIANYYAQVHPGVHLLGLNLEGYNTNDEEISDDYYLNTIRPQILAAKDSQNQPILNSNIDVIVTTKGLPLRIYVDNPNPGAYVDPFGVNRTVPADCWKPYSSLESELTRIDVISTQEQMGDQYFFNQTTPPNPSLNPYYPNFPYPVAKPTVPFDYSNYYIAGYGGMRLTARLDGFTTGDVKAAINKAQQAFLIPNSRWVVLDDDPNSVGGDRMIQLKNNVLAPKSQAYVYENTDTATLTAPGPVIGYVSHGVNDGVGGLEPGYIAGQLNFTLANGAVFQTHESFNAYSFQPGENMGGQGLVAEWLAIGGTAGVGHVQEPMSGTNYEANEDQMYKMLLDGYTWAESAWGSITQLSYVNTVVGDPLMVWKKVLPGDANLDGLVNVADLSLLGKFWGTTGQAGGYLWSHGDFNADGIINVADLSLLGQYWGQTSSWADGGASTAGPLDMEAFLASVPEPSSTTLAFSVLVALLAGYEWRRLRPPCQPNELPKLRLISNNSSFLGTQYFSIF